MSFDRVDPAERQKILAKLSRLKALSECKTGNVNETAVAAAAMTRLMLEYKIELAELEGRLSDSQIGQEEILGKERTQRYPVWQVHLLSRLAETNDCIGYQEIDGWARRVKLCLLGRSEDIRHTALLFRFCLDEVERLCRYWNPQAPRRLKNDFRMGAAMAIGHKVQEERAQVRAAQQSCQALVWIDQHAERVQEAAVQAGIRSRARPHRRPVAASAYQAGYAAGRAVQFPSDQQVLPAG